MIIQAIGFSPLVKLTLKRGENLIAYIIITKLDNEYFLKKYS